MAMQREAAAHLGITRRQFVELLDDGHVERKSEGQYDLGEVCRQVVAYYKDRSQGELDREKTRVAKSQADRNEIDISERQRRLLPLELFEWAWMKLASVFRTNAMAIPSGKASRFVGLKTIAQAEERLREVIDELLKAISSTDARRVIAVDRKNSRQHKAG